MSKLTKEQYIIELKKNWDILSNSTKQNFISSLLGHRMSFKTIGELISRTPESIREAYNVVDLGGSPMVVEPNETEVKNEAQVLVTPSIAKIMAVAPEKMIYQQSFDEILVYYRELLGWQNEVVIAAEPRDDDGYHRGCIISDLHAPFHNETAFLSFIKDAKKHKHTDICVLAGDGVDFHNFSKYMKYGQYFTVREEHKAFMNILAILSETFTKVVVMPGNHDDRARKMYAKELHPELYQNILDHHGPDAFDFSLLMCKNFTNVEVPKFPQYEWADFRFVYQLNDIIIGHPEMYSKIPNKSVGTFIEFLYKKALMYGVIKPFRYAVMGHTHMSGKTWNDYGVIGIENGCLCMTPDYDGNPQCAGAFRPATLGYTRFATDLETGMTNPNDINFIQL